MSQADFVMLRSDPENGAQPVSVNFSKGSRQHAQELDRYCPLFGHHVLSDPLRLVRKAIPPVIWWIKLVKPGMFSTSYHGR